MLQYNHYLGILFFILCACDSRSTNKSATESEYALNGTSQIVPSGMLEVDTAVVLKEVETETRLLEEHLFGKFFNDRAEFYIIKNPGNKMFHSDIEKITLYYIDGILCKTRYDLDRAVAEALVDNYGSFKIMGLDSMNTRIVKSRDVLRSEAGLTKLNSELNCFEMTWRKRGKVFVYRHVDNDSIRQFTFVEKLDDYDRRLRSVDVIFERLQ